MNILYKEPDSSSSIVQDNEHQRTINFSKKDHKHQKQDVYEVVSLFSGCGGLDLGFQGGFNFRHYSFPKTKFKPIFANDIDAAAALVHNANPQYFEGTKFIHSDVKNIATESVPDFDFLIAGFPCQPFSNAGLRKGIEDERGNLFEECERLLGNKVPRHKKPLGFVFENVRGMLSSKMADGTSVPDEIVKRMKEHGYITKYKLINTADYGVPSNRYRVIMIGFREELGAFDFDSLHEVVAEHNLPNKQNNMYDLCLGSILCDIPNNDIQKEEYWKYSPGGQFMVDKIGFCVDGADALSQFQQKKPLSEISETITQGRSWKNMDYEDFTPRFRKIWDDPKKYHAPNFYRRFALGEINGTITASAQPENCGITHPFENRRFSVREIARIQSFPDDFVFPNTSIANAYKVIGNAVPPIMGWVIAQALLKHLEQ
jgi:DNA (cytosine-5)-methyltransferase 1